MSCRYGLNSQEEFRVKGNSIKMIFLTGRNLNFCNTLYKVLKKAS